MQAINIEEKNGLGVNQSTSGKNVSNNICGKQIKTSYFLKIKDNNVTNEIELDEILSCIPSDPLTQAKIKNIRAVYQTEPDRQKCKKLANQFKETLPSFCASLFSPPIRNKKNFKQADIMIFDLDDFMNTEAMLQVKNDISKESYAVFVSPSGNGLKIIYTLSETVTDVEIFQSNYKRKNTELAKRFGHQCKADNTFDVSRVCYMSEDPNIIINPEAPALKIIAPDSIESILDGAVVDLPGTANQPTTAPVSIKVKKVSAKLTVPATGDDSNISRYSELLSKLDPDGDYKSWLDAGIAGKNIDDACYDLWNDWSTQSEKYQAGECSAKWKSFEIEMSPTDAIAWLEKMAGEKHWWRIITDKETGEFQELFIDEIQKEKFLADKGIAKTYRNSPESIYIQRNGCVIEEISKERISDILYADIKPNEFAFNIAIKKCKEQIAGEQTLKSTVHLKEHMLHWDDRNTCYLYFADKVVKIEKDRYSTIDYGAWLGDEVIWRDSLLKQKSDVLEEESVIEKFVRNAVGATNVESMMTCIGYMLHRFKLLSNTKLVSFCDADADDGASKGGRGKGIIAGQLLGRYRNTKVIDGRSFDLSGDFPWQGVSEAHSVIYIEDARKSFPFEKLFNFVTNGMTVNNKNMPSFYIPFERLGKFIIDSNFIIGDDNESSKRRRIDVPFTAHYSSTYTPADEFGHTLFTDWDDAEWARCNWFVVRCIQLFLQKGLVYGNTSSLSAKRIQKEVGPMFDWIRVNLVFLRNENTVKAIQGKYIDDEGLPDKEKIDGRRTVKALRTYAEKHGMTLEDKVVKEFAKSTRKFRLYMNEEQTRQQEEAADEAIEKYSDELAKQESEYQDKAPF